MDVTRRQTQAASPRWSLAPRSTKTKEQSSNVPSSTTSVMPSRRTRPKPTQTPPQPPKRRRGRSFFTHRKSHKPRHRKPKPTFHPFPRLPIELQIHILRYAATPVRKPIAIYTNERVQFNTYYNEVFAVGGSKICSTHYRRACGCRNIWSITHYEPAPPGRMKLDLRWLYRLRHVITNGAPLTRPPSPRPGGEISVMAHILYLNKWTNSKEFMEDRGLTKDTVRIEYTAGLLGTSRLARQIALEIWREMVRDVDEDGEGRVGFLAPTKMVVLRKLDGLVEQVKRG